jgi:uncharacterized protein
MAERIGPPVIDCDIHQFLGSVEELYPFLPRVYVEDLKQFGLRLPGSGYLNGGDRGYRIDSWPDDGGRPASNLKILQDQHLDVYNVEYGLLLGQDLRSIPQLPNADYAAALASAYNDWMIHEWLEKDERLKGAAFIAPQNPQSAANEIRRVGQHPDIVAVVVTNGARLPYGQRYYDPIYDACQEMGLPFMLHTGGEDAYGQPAPSGIPSYYIEVRQARPMGYMGHLASVVFEGLFERFPGLKVVFVEGGYTWLPTFLWRLDSDWRGLRSQTPWVKKPPSEYVFEHCLFTSQPMELPDKPRRLLTILEWAHAERTLMFASDYPHWDFDSPEMALPAMPDYMRDRVLTENARELFRLPQPARAPEPVAT